MAATTRVKDRSCQCCNFPLGLESVLKTTAASLKASVNPIYLVLVGAYFRQTFIRAPAWMLVWRLEVFKNDQYPTGYSSNVKGAKYGNASIVERCIMGIYIATRS